MAYSNTHAQSTAGDTALEACDERLRICQDRAVKAERTLARCLLALEEALPRWGATMLIALLLRSAE